LTVGPRDGIGGMDWTVDNFDQWVTEARPGFTHAATSTALWPSERSSRIGFSQINTRFATYRDALGLDPGLDFHSFRRSYVTHLIEDGWDPRFVQEQVGHEHASTTSHYTCVSSDFRTRTLRQAMESTLNAALGTALSSVQVWRLVTHTPERLSLPILAALCDIFDCTPADLIATKAENATPRRTATGETGEPSAQIGPIRPKRARIRPDQ
jgi:DNA-binding Xre family transcriptional regulator